MLRFRRSRSSEIRISDFGLALSSTFTLSSDEQAFLERHRDFDRDYVLAELYGVTNDPRHAAVATTMRARFAALRAEVAASR